MAYLVLFHKCTLRESRPLVRSDGWAVYRNPYAIQFCF